MKFTLRLREVDGGKEHEESYDKPDVTDARKWAEKQLAWFNSTLRPGESRRELLSVHVTDPGDDGAHHRWAKTAAYSGATQPYRCVQCGITGTRRIGETAVRHDRPYRAAVYNHCRKTKEHLKKLENRHPK